MSPKCPYCQRDSYKVDGDAIYPHRKDLHAKKFYACLQCDAYVGTHEASGLPLGRLANATLRRLKQAAHAAFDPLWRESSAKFDRSDAYTWLASQMGLSRDETHIGMFDEDQCRRVVNICSRFRKEQLEAHLTKRPMSNDRLM